MKARLVVDLDVELRGVQLVGDRILALTDAAICEIDGDRIVPMAEVHDAYLLRGDAALTREGRRVRANGDSFALGDLGGATPVAHVAVEDGAIVVVEAMDDVHAAAVLRYDSRGRVMWRAACPAPSTIGGYVTEMRAVDGWKPRAAPGWAPRSWSGASRNAPCISGDRVLVVFSDMPSSGIGIGYGIDLASGAVLYQTRSGPHGELASVGDGEFLVGFQGYGAFESDLVGRDGRVLATWPSHGILATCIRSGDARMLRLVELENITPSRCHVATLHIDGSVHHGAALPSYYTSPVIVADDGSMVFWRDDALVCVSPDGERLDRLHETPRLDRDAYSTAFAGRAPGRIAMVWAANVERDNKIVRLSKLLLFDIAR